MDKAEKAYDDTKSGGVRNSPFTWISALVIGFLLAGYGAWYQTNQNRVQGRNEVDIRFAEAPDTVSVGIPARFVVRLTREGGGDPLPGRPVNIVLTPEGKAEILSVSGGPARVDSAQFSRMGWGRSDGGGDVAILVRTQAPGEFHLVASDSVSAFAKSVSADFLAR